MHKLCNASHWNIPTAFRGSVQGEIFEAGFATVKSLIQVSNKTCHPLESLFIASIRMQVIYTKQFIQLEISGYHCGEGLLACNAVWTFR
jgi:hypothetical protein